MPNAEEQNREEVDRILKELSPEEQQLLVRVIEAEQAKIHMSSPHGIYEDIRKAIEETIRN